MGKKKTARKVKKDRKQEALQQHFKNQHWPGVIETLKQILKEKTRHSTKDDVQMRDDFWANLRHLNNLSKNHEYSNRVDQRIQDDSELGRR